ncbi:MAG: hypothetical protein OXF56_26310 [Rhodobacteraceae bacterium]|nr:hypothetical protein [Paracoccaceae bacterium]
MIKRATTKTRLGLSCLPFAKSFDNRITEGDYLSVLLANRGSALRKDMVVAFFNGHRIAFQIVLKRFLLFARTKKNHRYGGEPSATWSVTQELVFRCTGQELKKQEVNRAGTQREKP